MTRLFKKKNIVYLILFCFIASLSIGALISTDTLNSAAYAEENEINEDIEESFVVRDTANDIPATFTFSVVNDKECSVRIVNKTAATVAAVPSRAEIDGKVYEVTQIAPNGFMSSTKLERVKLPPNIKKIGNMAFANCSALESICLNNVEELGSSVFYRCAALKQLIIPDSLLTIGATILRSSNTQVLVRDNEDKAGWASNWNSGNANQNVNYNYDEKEPLILETVYSTSLALANSENESQPSLELEGYVVADGQPRSENFYAEVEDNNIFIPNMYNGEYILGIASTAFEGASFGQLIIEYSSQTLKIGTEAFLGVSCENITINRNVKFCNPADDTEANNIFSFSEFNTIVLPDSIDGIADQMFADCINLTNIYFSSPTYIEKRSDMLKIIDRFAKRDEQNEIIDKGIVHMPQSATFTTIGESAFAGVNGITELHIYDNVKTIEASICAYWLDDQQIYVHNNNYKISEENGFNWHPQWHNDVSDANIHYDAKYYTITFHYDNGTDETFVKDVKFGEPIGEMPVPQAQYKEFNVWTDNTRQWTEDSIYDIERDLDLHAGYDAYIFYVGYDANKPVDANDPVVGTMQPTAFAASDYITEQLAPIGYSIRGWDFLNWCIIVDDVTLTFDDEEAILIIDVLEELGLEIYNGIYISLCAMWELHEYVITYDAGAGTNPSDNPPYYTVNTETFVFLPPRREGYNGYWDIQGIEKGSIAEDITVTAYYTPNNIHRVTLQYCDGETTQSTFNFDENDDYYLTSLERTNYHFVGWKLQGTANTFVTNLKGFKDDVTLEAVWVETGTKYTLTSTTTALAVTATNSTIELPDFHNFVEIVVSQNVKQLYLYASNFSFHNIRITVQEGRSSDFSLIMNNVTIQSLSSTYATVKMTDDYVLNIVAYKDCRIIGATGTIGENGDIIVPGVGEDGSHGGNGGVAVQCVYLNLYTPITILGGNGGSGGDGRSSSHGGNGGKGGNGNYAVICKKINIQSSDILIQGGNGGSGGHGGSGIKPYDNGKGALGGFGSLATIYLIDELEPAEIIGTDNYSNVSIVKGTVGKKGVDGGEIHEVIH